MREKEIEAISPMDGEIIEQMDLAPRLDTVEGKTVYQVWNGGDRAASDWG